MSLVVDLCDAAKKYIKQKPKPKKANKTLFISISIQFELQYMTFRNKQIYNYTHTYI